MFAPEGWQIWPSEVYNGQYTEAQLLDQLEKARKVLRDNLEEIAIIEKKIIEKKGFEKERV